MRELWVIQVKIGTSWSIRYQALTKERLLEQADLYAGRALESGQEVRVCPYVIDESRIEILESSPIKKV